MELASQERGEVVVTARKGTASEWRERHDETEAARFVTPARHYEILLQGLAAFDETVLAPAEQHDWFDLTLEPIPSNPSEILARVGPALAPPCDALPDFTSRAAIMAVYLASRATAGVPLSGLGARLFRRFYLYLLAGQDHAAIRQVFASEEFESSFCRLARPRRDG